jgi:hypothetical protein
MYQINNVLGLDYMSIPKKTLDVINIKQCEKYRRSESLLKEQQHRWTR